MTGHWLLDPLAEKRKEAMIYANQYTDFYKDFSVDNEHAVALNNKLLHVVNALEIAVVDLKLDNRHYNYIKNNDALVEAARDAFLILKIMPISSNWARAATRILRTCAFGIIAKREDLAVEWLLDLNLEGREPELPVDSNNWLVRCRASVLDSWMRLVHWSDFDGCEDVSWTASRLFAEQKVYEPIFLKVFAEKNPEKLETCVLELAALYYLQKAVDTLGGFIGNDVIAPDEEVNIQDKLEVLFEHAAKSCDAAGLVELGSLSRLLSFMAFQIKDDYL